MKHNIYHGRFKSKDGKFIPADKAEEIKFNSFRKELEEDQIVEVFMESEVDNGTVPQLAKIHACIRELAKETGYTFEEVQGKQFWGLFLPPEEKTAVQTNFHNCVTSELRSFLWIGIVVNHRKLNIFYSRGSRKEIKALENKADFDIPYFGRKIKYSRGFIAKLLTKFVKYANLKGL